jgi:hypothetical protein
MVITWPRFDLGFIPRVTLGTAKRTLGSSILRRQAAKQPSLKFTLSL